MPNLTQLMITLTISIQLFKKSNKIVNPKLAPETIVITQCKKPPAFTSLLVEWEGLVNKILISRITLVIRVCKEINRLQRFNL